MAKHLQDFTNAAIWPVKGTPIVADSIALANSEAANAPTLIPISALGPILTGIPASNIANTPSGNLAATTVQAALDELQSDINGLTAISGQYEGSSATFAGLPSGANVEDGDWSLQTAQDGGNPPGIYVRAAGAWTLGRELPAADVAMVAATAGAAGAGGNVPAPAAGDQVHVLTGAATWVDPTTLVSDMGGATAGAAGAAGLVPAPAAGDQTAFLTGAGTWASAPAGSLQATTDVGTVTTNDMEITDAAKGLILTAADAGRWRVTIDNDGSLVTAAA